MNIKKDILTEAQRLAIIANAVAQAKLARNETLVSEFGLLDAQKEDVVDECQHLDSLDHEEEIDFDADENETDMNTISPAMRGAFAWAF